PTGEFAEIDARTDEAPQIDLGVSARGSIAEVYGHDEAATFGLPRVDHDVAMGVVPLVGGTAGVERPCAVVDQRIAQDREQLLVERVELGIDRFCETTRRVDRHASASTFGLPVMEHAHARCEGGDERSGAVLVRGEYGRSPRLVVVLEEMHGLALMLRVGAEMRTKALSVRAAEMIVERLVVREVEALLLELPFAVPVGFGDEDEAGGSRPDLRDRGRPKRLEYGRVAVGQPRGRTPRALHHVRAEQHRHVAAYAVAARGHGREF